MSIKAVDVCTSTSNSLNLKKNQLPLLLETEPDWDDVEDDVEPVNIQIGLKGYDGLSRIIHRT